MKVEDVMSRDVLSVSPGTSLKEVAQILVEHRISGLPVVDSNGGVLGVISEADILIKESGMREPLGGPLDWLFNTTTSDDLRKLEATVAGEAMTSPAITIDHGRAVSAAAALMLERGINRLPVLRREQLVGIVTRADLVRAFARQDADVAREIREGVVKGTLWLDTSDLAVEVDAGKVLLRGKLEQRSEAELLPRLVARVPGVVSVRSELSWNEDE